MNIPKNINQAVIAIWFTIVISAVAAVINKQIAAIDSEKFMFYLVTYGIFCIFPYKISKGSNPARYVFAILTVIGYLFLLGGETTNMTKLDIVLSVLLVPVYGFIFYRLFSNEGNNWFTQVK
jgi:hypothetical protein